MDWLQAPIYPDMHSLMSITDGNSIVQVSPESLVMAQNLEILKIERPEDWLDIMLTMYCPPDSENLVYPMSTSTSTESPPSVPMTPQAALSDLYDPLMQQPLPLTPKRSIEDVKGFVATPPRKKPTSRPILTKKSRVVAEIIAQLSQLEIEVGLTFHTASQARFYLWAYCVVANQNRPVRVYSTPYRMSVNCKDENCPFALQIHTQAGLCKVVKVEAHGPGCTSLPGQELTNATGRLTKQSTSHFFYFLPDSLTEDEKIAACIKFFGSFSKGYSKLSADAAWREHGMENDPRCLPSLITWLSVQGAYISVKSKKHK